MGPKYYLKAMFGRFEKTESNPSRWERILACLIWDFGGTPILGPIIERLRIITLKAQGKM